MSGWAIVAVVAIAVWGVVQAIRARHGITSDKQGNQTYVGARDAEAQAEIEELRERIKVLERIATDKNGEAERLARKIEDLRED